MPVTRVRRPVVGLNLMARTFLGAGCGAAEAEGSAAPGRVPRASEFDRSEEKVGTSTFLQEVYEALIGRQLLTARCRNVHENGTRVGDLMAYHPIRRAVRHDVAQDEGRSARRGTTPAPPYLPLSGRLLERFQRSASGVAPRASPRSLPRVLPRASPCSLPRVRRLPPPTARGIHSFRMPRFRLKPRVVPRPGERPQQAPGMRRAAPPDGASARWFAQPGARSRPPHAVPAQAPRCLAGGRGSRCPSPAAAPRPAPPVRLPEAQCQATRPVRKARRAQQVQAARTAAQDRAPTRRPRPRPLAANRSPVSAPRRRVSSPPPPSPSRRCGRSAPGGC